MSFDYKSNIQTVQNQYYDNEEWFEYGGSVNSYRDLGLVVGKVAKPLMPQVQESVQDVPGMYGNIFTGNDYGELTFTIPVTMMSFDHTSYNMITENLKAMLTADASDPGVEYPLVFGDRPEVTYYGHWGQISDPTFLTTTDWQAQTNLTFICSQPYGYLPEQNVQLTMPGQSFTPLGNATSYPIYTMYLKKDIYNVGYVDLNDNGEYVATGYTVDNENTDDEGNRIQNNEILTTNEDPTLLSDWITGSEAEQQMAYKPDGAIDGSISDGNFWNSSRGITVATTHRNDGNTGRNNIPALDYGDPKSHGPAALYGPYALHSDFNNPTDNWCVMVNLWNDKDSSDHSSDRARGRLDVDLLDQNHHKRGTIWIHDWSDGRRPRVNVTLTGSDGSWADILNENTYATSNEKGYKSRYDDSIGPHYIDGLDVRRTPKNGPVRFTLTSVWQYKKEVKNAVKANKRSTNKKLTQNRKRNASRAAQRANSVQKYGNARHVSHRHYHLTHKRKGR